MEIKPIPAFYCCYLIRSTVRKASNYVGSTPNMLRRLRQHNGETKGGAKRTSHHGLKPWEVTCLVHGFPSKIAALQFEWAWQHAHISRHIDMDQRAYLRDIDVRISPKSGKLRKRKVPAKPRSMTDQIANLHTLLRAKSFSRWPLALRFFATDVFRVWKGWDAKSEEDIRPSVDVSLDPMALDPHDKTKKATLEIPDPAEPIVKNKFNGVENLDFGYSKMKPHIEKNIEILARTDNTCAVCSQHLDGATQPVLVCPHEDCAATSHLDCLSREFTRLPKTTNAIVPIEGSCPSCRKSTQWQSLVQDLTLRLRGDKEVALLFKKVRARKGAEADEPELPGIQEVADEDVAEDDDDEFILFEDFEAQQVKIAEGETDTTDKPQGLLPKPKPKAIKANTVSNTQDAVPKRPRGRPRKDSASSQTGWTDVEVLD